MDKNLIEQRKAAKLSQKQLAEKSGVSQQLISQIERGVNVSTKHLPALARALECQVSDLEESYGLHDEAAGANIVVQSDAAGVPTDIPLVPVYDVHASAGPGAVVDHYEAVIYSLAFPPAYLKSLTSTDPRNLVIISVKGDSMLPTLKEDDVVMVDRSKTSLGYDGLFVLRFDDVLHVKRVSRSSQKDHVRIISDNQAVGDFERHKSDVEVIGKVLWAGGKV